MDIISVMASYLKGRNVLVPLVPRDGQNCINTQVDEGGTMFVKSMRSMFFPSRVVRDRECPFCGAQKGMPCITNFGKFRQPHAVRKYASPE